MNRLISILLPNLVGGGVERIRIVLAHEFVREGYDVEFVLMQARGPLLEEARAAFPVVDLECSRVRSLPFSLCRYLRRRRPDALLAAMWPLTVIAPLAARLSGHGCKVLISEHNTLSLQYRNWGRAHRAVMRGSMAIGYRLADQRVAVSAGVAKDISGISGLSPASFRVIHNPLPVRPVPSDELTKSAEELWDSPPGARILTVGSMKTQKNHPLLLRALSQLERLDARLMIVGDGSRRDALETLARELGLFKQIIFAGFQSDPSPYYQTADLFVLSSDYEGFGNVLIEALAWGLPVVSTDCPSGPAEILCHGEYGQLVTPGDAEAFAQAIARGLDQGADTLTMKERAADFSPANAAGEYLKLLTTGE